MKNAVAITPPTLQARGSRVLLRPIALHDAKELVALHRASRAHFGSWTPPTLSLAEFRKNFVQWTRPGSLRYVVCLREDGRIVGDVAFSQIFFGRLKSAYMGYSIGAAYAGQGYMQEALLLALRYVFRELKLNRVEANIQPGNCPSIALAQRLGFSMEGYSRRYLKLANGWRDHQRWTLLACDWKPSRRMPHAESQPTDGVEIRDLGLHDIAAFAVLRHRISVESKFMLDEPAESLARRDELAERLAETLTDPARKRILAVAGRRVVGYVSGARGERQRNQHSVHVGIGLLEAYAGRGIGRRLMDKMEAWAREIGARRLDLRVMVNNKRAVALYLHCGYSIEGRTRGEFLIDGKLVDAYFMGKILE
jgi:ribosomal-protein-alanine N-acetyltransferase